MNQRFVTRSAVAEKVLSANEFLYAPLPEGYHYELVRGTVVREPVAFYGHARVAAAIGARLYAYVDKHHLGDVAVGDPGFIVACDPDTVRAPDVAFISRQRTAKDGRVAGFVPGAPDLAIEVRSPGNTRAEFAAKVSDYLHAGARLVWLVDPIEQCATVYASGREPLSLGADGLLDGEDVVPGFRLRLADVWG